MAVSISISITQNSQNIANNTSNVTVKVIASWTGGSWNLLQKSGWLKIDGATYNFTNSFNDNETTTGNKTLFTKTVNVTHNSNGSKTLSCSASYTSGVSSGTVTASASKVLTTIARESTMTATTGTDLGTEVEITVTRQSPSLTHTITYKCGKATGTICTKSSGTSITWTPPISLASQYPTKTSIGIVYTITTYSGSTQIGSPRNNTFGYKVPASVKPSCSIKVSDAAGHYSTYGAYVQGLSKFSVTVTGKESQGAAIKTYKTTANGATYTAESFTTGTVSSAGTLKISATVTDERGRSGTDTESVTVLAYSAPKISKLSVNRCNKDGTANDQGEWVKVSYAASITSLNSKNTATYTLKHKKTSDSSYTTDVSSTSSSSGSYIFEADTASAYDVEFSVTDKHKTTTKTTSVSTAFTILHFKADGTAISIGKIAELSNVLDIGMQTRFYGGILNLVLEPNTDLDDVRTPNTYVGENVSTYGYTNCPLTSGTFTLEVISMGDNGQVMQRLTQCNKTAYIVYERVYYSSSWGSWMGGWNYPTLSSAFTLYNDSTANQVRYRKDGRVVEVRGIVTPVSDIAGSTTSHTMFTLPVGYRPSLNVYAVCQGSQDATWLLGIGSNGVVTFSRYRDNTGFITAVNGNWLPIHATFILDQ